MTDSNDTFDLHDKRLSLIDVSFEDDSLYSSPSRDFSAPHVPGKIEGEDKTVNDLEFKESKAVEASFDSIEEKGEEEEDPAPLESLMEGAKKTGKYNLRKSLAWDSAFFTSAGVLEPDELSSMIGGAGEERIGKCTLPGIAEESFYRSTDSISTLASDNFTLDTIEADLFSDIRASIQKSSNSSSSMNSGGKLGSGIRANQDVQSSEKMDIGSRNKAKTKAAPKKPDAIMQGSGRFKKQIVNSSPSTCKPPKVAEIVSPNLTSASKRVSLGANRGKMEKDISKSSLGNSDNAKTLTTKIAGKGIKAPTLGTSRNTLPKPRLPSKSSLGSTKTVPTTSSSVDSSASLSSDNSSKSSLSSGTRKVDSRTGNRSSSLTVKSTLRVASRTKGQLTSSRPSPHLKSVTRLSCSISPASSISEWSSGSLSPTSTLNKGSNSSRTSLGASSSAGDGETAQVSSHLNHCSQNSGADVSPVQGLLHEHIKRVSTGGSSLIRPESIKPTGLRMPSPKIGFFDGVKSALRTPNRSMKSNSAVPGVLPKVGGVSVSPNGGSNEAKRGKFQPVRTVLPVRGTKVASQQPAADKEPRSPLQESSNTAAKITSATRKEKQSPAISAMVQNRPSSENGGTNNLKGEKVAQKQNTVTNNPVSEMDVSHLVLKDSVSPEEEDIAPSKDVQITSAIGEANFTLNSSPTSEVKNIILQQKEKTCSEDQVDSLIKQVKDIDIHKETKKEHVNDYSQIDNIEVNFCETEEYLKPPSPASSMRSTVAETEKTDTVSYSQHSPKS